MAEYDPKVDSSPSEKGRAGGKLGVVIHVEENQCGCGCEQPKARPGRRFLQGHDAKLKGILSRAHRADVDVTFTDGKATETTAAGKAITERGWPIPEPRAPRKRAAKKAPAKKAATKKAASRKAPAKRKLAAVK